MGEWLLVLVPKAPRLPVKVVETLIVWFVELSVVAMGSVVLPAVFDKYSAVVVVLGLSGSGIFLMIALLLAWRVK